MGGGGEIGRIAGGPPSPRAAPVRADPKLLVLIYHNLVYGRTGNEYNRDLYNFEHDLDFLRRNFRVLSFRDLVELREGRSPMTQDAAIISFDDGDLSLYALAFPLLREYGLKATFFIVPEFVGKVGYMSWEQIREIAAWTGPDGGRPFEIGSHSASHRELGGLSPEELERELRDSKAAIEAATGLPVETLALPFGSGAGRPDILGMAAAAGYRAIRSSVQAAPPIGAVDLLDIGALSVDNGSHDSFVQRALRLLGR